MARGNFKRRGNTRQKSNKSYNKNRNKIQDSSGGSKKRKLQHVEEEHNLTNEKKSKISEIQYTSSESENENEVAFKKLVSTFSNKDNLKNKIESTDDSDSSEESHSNSDLEGIDELSDKSDMEDESKLEIEEDDVKEQSGKNEVVENTAEQEKEEIIEDKEIDEETEKEENGEKLKDPFCKHFLCDLSEKLLESVQKNPMQIETKTCVWNKLGKLIIQIPKPVDRNNEGVSKTVALISDDTVYAEPGEMPELINLHKETLKDLHIKSQIVDNVNCANEQVLINHGLAEVPFTGLQTELFSVINNYQDLYYPERTFKNAEEIRFIYCLHAVNHIIKTRTKIVHHNARLSKKSETPDEYRDQGLVRPKVLIVVPFRDSAYRIINMIINILVPGEKGQVINKNRFVEDFTGSELAMPKKNPRPEDYEQLFSGNTDDAFKIGLSVTKKSLKLYADFYSSDIIIASPLGLRLVVGVQGEHERDYDFLASIELLILDQTEQFLMQNWDHLLLVLEHLHLQPKDSHGTDFARVRMWSLNGWAKYYRQTLIFSSYNTPEINSVFNKRCFNYAGKARIVNPIVTGSICQVFVQVPQVFHKLNVTNVKQSVDARFDFFINKILPEYKDSIMKHTLIYIPSYYDFIKIRNYFKKEELSFVQIWENSKDSKIARARDLFYHADAHFLLYSERFHHFRRIRLKGIRHIIFYQPSTVPNFYPEIINYMIEANQNPKTGNKSNMSVSVIYCKYDVHYVTAIVGTERFNKMIQSERNTHMFTTGE